MDKETIYKAIPGNNEWSVSLDGKFKMREGVDRATPLEIEGEYVEIEMFGKTDRVWIGWLALISYYELDNELCVNRAVFGPESNGTLWNVAGHWMYYTRPITSEDGFRRIPRFTKYEVNKQGVIREVSTGKIITVTRTKEGQYPIVSLYDPTKGCISNVLVHRAVALAWCYNDNPYMYNEVDHVDKDTSNYNAYNLEWVNRSDNQIRAHRLGSKQAKRIRVRNIYTGNEMGFYSITEMWRYFGSGTRSTSAFMDGLHPGLLDYEYEVKLADDDSDWIYTPENVPQVIARNKIHVVHPDGTEETVYGITELTRRFKLWNIYPATVENKFKIAQERNPDLKLTLEILSKTEECHVLDTTTGEITTWENMAQAARHVGDRRSTIRAWCKRYDLRYLFKNRWKLHLGERPEGEWPEETLFRLDNNKAITVTNLETNEVHEYESLRETSRKTGVSRTVISRSMKDNTVVKGIWKFEKHTDINV